MRRMTQALTYCNSPETLRYQVEGWKRYGAEERAATRIVIVDDCSEVCPVDMLREVPINLELYRVLDDIEWNCPGARNLGTMMARDTWIVQLDDDHHLPAKSARALIGTKLDPECYYTFGRVALDGTTLRSHMNTLLYRQVDYWRAGGFDEDFAGRYGHDDQSFLWRLRDVLGVKHRRIGAAPVVMCGLPERTDRERDWRYNFALRKRKERDNEMPQNYIRFRWERVL